MRKLKKTPIQIYLDPDQDKILTMLSKTSGKSKAGIIRACLDKFIASLPPDKDPLMDILELGTSDKSDIAEKHDEYLMSCKE